MIDKQTIEGVLPDQVVSPTSDREIAEVLHQQLSDDSWVMPTGGGTAVTTGNVVARMPVLLNLDRLTGILEYEPADLTVSVAAGTRWSELIAALADNGQTVPIDVPFPDAATVGGVVATGWAGPRRLRDGTIKDLLIGASFVRGDGLIAKAGGMVVKNVSGFEIPRLLHGSYGSLAVISSVNLKVIPKHEAELTLRSGAVPFSDGVEELIRLTRSQPTIAAAIIDGNGSEGEIAIRLSGRRYPIRQLANNLREVIRAPLLSNHLEDDESAEFWQRRSDALARAPNDRVCIEVGSRPAEIGRAIERLWTELRGIEKVRYCVSPGTGSEVIEFPATGLSHDSWSSVWNRFGQRHGARHVVLHAPRAWRIGAQVWSIPEDQSAIMGALKHQFDPDSRLNRGRLWDTAPVGSSMEPVKLENMN